MSFYRLKPHFFLEAHTVLLYRCAIYLYVHSSVEGHLDFFYACTIMNEASMNICVNAFMWTLFSIHFGKYQCNYWIIRNMYV